MQDRDLSANEKSWKELLTVEAKWNITDIKSDQISLIVEFTNPSEVSAFRNDKDNL